MDWSEIEDEIGCIPMCLKVVLSATGYESLQAIAELNEQKINECEEYIASHDQNVVADLNCCHSEKYKSQNRFMFLPGHRTILQILPKTVKTILSARSCNRDTSSLIKSSQGRSASRSVILNELIKTSDTNSQNQKNHAKYSDTIKDFFTYIYLLSGKSCYETLNANLSIPSTKTIRKCK